jgi:hypothetical protein
MTLFDPCQVEVSDDRRRVRGFKITCGKCSAFEKIALNRIHGAQNHADERVTTLATRKFNEAGWKVAKSPGQHRCPVCVREAVQAKPFAHLEALKEKPVTHPAPTLADPPPEMKLADRQIILAKLLDAYDGTKGCYAADWTDKRVAEDLGVPRAWVTKLREENFGPEGGNAALYEQLAEARAVLERGKLILERTTALREQVDKLLLDTKPVAEAVAKLERQVAGIEKAVRP